MIRVTLETPPRPPLIYPCIVIACGTMAGDVVETLSSNGHEAMLNITVDRERRDALLDDGPRSRANHQFVRINAIEPWSSLSNQRPIRSARHRMKPKLLDLFTRIDDELQFSTMDIVICVCVGGSTGSIAAGAISRELRRKRHSHTVVATLPFANESSSKYLYATKHVGLLGRSADRLLLVNLSAIDIHQRSRSFPMTASLEATTRIAATLRWALVDPLTQAGQRMDGELVNALAWDWGEKA